MISTWTVYLDDTNVIRGDQDFAKSYFQNCPFTYFLNKLTPNRALPTKIPIGQFIDYWPIDECSSCKVDKQFAYMYILETKYIILCCRMIARSYIELLL